MSKDLDKKQPQEVVEFNPTPAMEKWLDTAIEIASDSPTEIGEASKISRQTWYDWLKVDGFEDWYYLNYQKKRRRWLPTLDKIGMQQSQKGKYDFWRDMRKAAGEVEDKGDKTQINIVNAISTQKEKYDI